MGGTENTDRRLRFGIYRKLWVSQVVLMVKNPPANARDIRETVSIPGLGRCPGEGHGNLLQYLACRIPWTDEPGRLSSKESDMIEVT